MATCNGYEVDHRERFTWKRSAITMLIRLRTEMEEDFEGNGILKKVLWQKISCAMQDAGYIVTANDCDKKWRNLKSTYMKIKEGTTSKTGRGRHTWEFFYAIDDCIGKRFQPPSPSFVCAMEYDMAGHDDTMEMEIKDLPTPAFLVDKDKVEANCDQMLKKCKRLGLDLRPHVKTHKCIEAATLETGGSKRRISVSTLKEAEFFCEAGFEDILYAYPLEESKIQRCKELSLKMEKFHVMIDSTQGFNLLSSNALDAKESEDRKPSVKPSKKWSVFVSLCCGGGREGVTYSETDVEFLPKALTWCDFTEFAGFYAHCGNSYDLKSQMDIISNATSSCEKLLSVVQKCQDKGIECPVYGLGSTPSCSCALQSFSKLTEVHPGNYAFYDVQQMLLNSCHIDDIACKVATRVVGCYEDRNYILVDCGYMALTKQGLLDSGYGLIENEPDLKLVSLNQEIGKIESKSGKLNFKKYPVGTMLFIYPYHSCATAGMHPVYFVHRHDKIIEKWIPTRGW